MSKSSLNKLGVSSSKLAEIAYQESYNYYLSTKEKERIKLTKRNDTFERKKIRLQVKEFKEIQKNKKFLSGPDDGGDDDLKLIEALYKDANRNFRYGKHLIKTGQKTKGLTYISFASFEISLLPGLISNLLNSV